MCVYAYCKIEQSISCKCDRNINTSAATNDGPKDQNPHEDYAKGPTPHEVEDARSLTPHEDEDARSLTPQEDDTRGQDSLEASILASS